MINKWKSIFKNSDFIKNSSLLTVGSFISQVIGVLSLLVLTRQYTVEAFGEWAFFSSVVGLLSVAGALRYEIAIVTTKTESELASLVTGSIAVSTCFTVLLFGLFYLFQDAVNQFYFLIFNKHLGNLLLLIPFMFFFIVLNNILFNWFVKKNEFRYNVISRVTKAVGVSVFAIIFGYFYSDGYGLILGSIIGQCLSVLIILPFVFKDWIKMIGVNSIRQVRLDLKANRKFAYVNTPHVVVDKIQNDGFIFVIGQFFGDLILGSYSFTLKVLKTPMALISQAVSQAFFQKTSVSDPKNRKKLVLQLYKVTMVGFIISLLLIPCFPFVFKILFGEKWVVAGEYCQILMPYFYITFVASILSSITIVVNEQEKAFGFSIIGAIIRFSALFIGFYFKSFTLSLTLLAVIHSIVFVYILYWYYKISSKVI